jgi:tetratricopeptide (TPR) repeat protein
MRIQGYATAEIEQKSAVDREQLARLGRELVDQRKSDQPLSIRVARAYYDLGRMQLEQNDVPKAAASLAYAIELDPNQPEYRVHRCNLYASVGFYELAMDEIAEAIKLCPANPQSYSLKGLVYNMVAGLGPSSVIKEAIGALALPLNWTLLSQNILCQGPHSVQTTAYRGLADIDVFPCSGQCRFSSSALDNG